jgi:hypothetical protein
MTDDYANWVVEASAGLKRVGSDTAELHKRGEQRQDYDAGVNNRVSMRATELLGKNLTRAEARADLYAVCVSLQD